MDATAALTEILEQMSQITRMRRGKLTEQYNRKKDKDGQERRWGPYYTLQAWVDGKNRSERVRCDDVDTVHEDMHNYEEFCKLSERYIQIAEHSAKTQPSDAKKKPKPQHKRARAKPKPPSI
jgi:carboxypeptidase C (cathepsin A)